MYNRMFEVVKLNAFSTIHVVSALLRLITNGLSTHNSLDASTLENPSHM